MAHGHRLTHTVTSLHDILDGIALSLVRPVGGPGGRAAVSRLLPADGRVAVAVATTGADVAVCLAQARAAAAAGADVVELRTQQFRIGHVQVEQAYSVDAGRALPTLVL